VKGALYARYSTEMQSVASIEDQLRICARLAAQHGFNIVGSYHDAAMSGGTAQRPAYQQMLEAARRHEFDVIIAEDTSRLWRNLAEQAPRLAELADLGVHVVTHDLDTRSESAGILGAVLGASSETYRKEIARRTRRGLEGLARKGKPTGGRAYGYISARKSGTGQVEINQDEADVVHRIFKLYADGASPRAIAARLNQQNVASPGSKRERASRLTKHWVTSAIAGSVRDGLGILNNELYIGRVIWNRFKWVRSAADSSRRRRVPNPKSEWIVRTEDRLRIIPERLWERVKARQRAQTDSIGERVKRGLSRRAAKSTGRGPKFLFSGLLKCARCSANFIVVNARSYACANRINGKACSNTAYLPRLTIEAGLLEGIQRDLLAPAVEAEVCRRAMKLARNGRPPGNPVKAIGRLRGEIANLTDAIASGMLRSSPALAERLETAERELARLEAEALRPALGSVAHEISGLARDYRALVADLAQTLTGVNVARARAELRKLVGELRVETTEEAVELWSTHTPEQALMRLAGGSQQCA
jgi:DNA invertase Pin-like site-specific DNA recombinase